MKQDPNLWMGRFHFTFLLHGADMGVRPGGVMDQSEEETVKHRIGYRQPPTHAQFRKGVSGNPHGRKKKVVRQGGAEEQEHPREETVPYPVGYKQPPTHSQFRKGVTGNPYGRKNERRFVEAILTKVLLSVTAPTPGRRSGSCTNMEAMFRALVMKGLEGDVVAFREIMEWVCEFGIGMESRLAARKLSLELQSHLLEWRKR